MVHSEFLKNEVKLAQDHKATRFAVKGDHQRLSQVFANLLKNAAKFSASGQTVLIETQNEGADLVVEIRDQGVGIEPKHLQQIFEPFEQTEQGSLHRYQGLGLGLTIAKRIVDLHEGSISAQSEGKDKGTSLFVRLRTI